MYIYMDIHTQEFHRLVKNQLLDDGLHDTTAQFSAGTTLQRTGKTSVNNTLKSKQETRKVRIQVRSEDIQKTVSGLFFEP